MRTKNTIDDKYTRPGYVEPIPGLYDGLAFEYRPMLPEQTEDFLLSLDRPNSGRGRVGIVTIMLANQLTAWSEVDAAGNFMAITQTNLALLPYPLLMRLRGIVEGRQASDKPESIDWPTLKEWVTSQLAVAAGEEPGAKQLKADQKN